MPSKKFVAAVGVVGLLLSRGGRARITSLSTSMTQALQRRRTRLPKGVEEFPAPLVDRRHTNGVTGQAAAGETATEVVAEYYQEHPPGA